MIMKEGYTVMGSAEAGFVMEGTVELLIGAAIPPPLALRRLIRFCFSLSLFVVHGLGRLVVVTP